LKRAEEAEAVLETALSLRPDYVEAHNNLGIARIRRGRPAAAMAAYERAIVLKPDYIEAHNNLGSALRLLGRAEEAQASFARAIALSPGYATPHANLGLALHDVGRIDDALAAYDKALALDPQHTTARANRAIALLAMGRFAEGWREYEWRWKVDGFTTAPRDFGRPAWDGGPLAGRTLLVHAEQGLGSAIQFVRYAPLLAAMGARVILEAQPPLAALFRDSLVGQDGPVADVVAKGEPLPAFDVHVPMMSLPHLLGTTLPTIPGTLPYLTAIAAAVERWRQRLAVLPRPWVGLVWAGNPRHSNDRNRSMPATALAPLATQGGATFFSLQVGPTAGVAAFAADTVRDLAPELSDFAETAAVVAALDLVISVDTAVAHLAGALARPVFLLLPAVAEWRWLRAGDDTPWYPTMRLFRQETAGNWGDVVARVATALRSLPLPA
jgi:hypothetical protein